VAAALPQGKSSRSFLTEWAADPVRNGSSPVRLDLGRQFQVMRVRPATAARTPNPEP